MRFLPFPALWLARNKCTLQTAGELELEVGMRGKLETESKSRGLALGCGNRRHITEEDGERFSLYPVF
jgi:hypothetical protein